MNPPIVVRYEGAQVWIDVVDADGVHSALAPPELDPRRIAALEALVARHRVRAWGGDPLDMDPDAEVRLAIQPGSPFEHSVGQVEEDMQTGVVYIAEAGQVGYLRDEVREWLGW